MSKDDHTPADPVREDSADPTDSYGQQYDEEHGSSPLDDIDDVDELRKVAKKTIKEKTIAYNRLKDKKGTEDTPAPEAPKPTGNEVFTKEDFYKSNETKAKEALTVFVEGDDESTFQKKQEFRNNFDAILEYYTPRRGRETESAIMQDLETARIAWRHENPPTEEKPDPIKAIETTPQKGFSPPPQKKDPSAGDPRFDKPKTPDQWYNKKEE